jgi:hypothetical protein
MGGVCRLLVAVVGGSGPPGSDWRSPRVTNSDAGASAAAGRRFGIKTAEQINGEQYESDPNSRGDQRAMMMAGWHAQETGLGIRRC